MNKKIKISLAASIAGMLVSLPSVAGSCSDKYEKKADDAFKAVKDEICSQLDNIVDMENNPYFYSNPDAGCDFGLSMPGLPDIGLGLDGIDACSLLKGVTSGMTDKLNQAMQDAVDDVTEGVDLNYNIDLTKMAEDAASGNEISIDSGSSNGQNRWGVDTGEVVGSGIDTLIKGEKTGD